MSSLSFSFSNLCRRLFRRVAATKPVEIVPIPPHCVRGDCSRSLCYLNGMKMHDACQQRWGQIKILRRIFLLTLFGISETSSIRAGMKMGDCQTCPVKSIHSVLRAHLRDEVSRARDDRKLALYQREPCRIC